MNRAASLFVAAVGATLLIGHALRDTPGYTVHNPDGTDTGDITHYVYWTRLITLHGIQSAYSGKWPETYAVYPPVSLYPYQLVGNAYRLLQDPSFDPNVAQQSLWLHEAIKFVALAWHLLTAVAIVLLLRRTSAAPYAAVAGAAYALNPAALYDVAHWAQPDGAHSLFSVLAVGLLAAHQGVRPKSQKPSRTAAELPSVDMPRGAAEKPPTTSAAALLGNVVAPWAALALAALAKPQAWAILPLVTLATVRTHGVLGLARGLGVGTIVSLVVALPFLFTGRVHELLALPATVSSVMPVVSADAHNLWWLILQPRGLDPLFVDDATRVFGPLTYRSMAAALVAAVLVLTYWLYWTRRATLAEAAALGVLGWFTFTTQAHENHLFFALPLLSLALPDRRSLLVPYGIITLTLLLNMLLHDQLVLDGLGQKVRLNLSNHDPLVEQLRLVNAAANVLCCVGWAVLAALRTRDVAASSATLRVRPRRTTRRSLEVAPD